MDSIRFTISSHPYMEELNSHVNSQTSEPAMKSHAPLITIITPTYNSGKFIKQLVENVQQQDFRDFEHLVMDGMSTDDTAQLLSDYCTVYPNMRFISEKDKGIYDAMNKGISLARGKWIFFLGSDDYFVQRDVLMNVARLLEENPDTEVVYGNVWAEMYNRVYDGKFNINKMLGQNICHQCIFYRKDLFAKMGLYDLRYRQNADYQFNLLCWLSGRVKHKYYPITVCFFSKGGASNILGDKLHAKDFPSVIIRTTLSGNWSFLRKVEIISQCFRKIIIRYPASVFRAQLTNLQDQLFIKILAIIWMVIASPYYTIKVIFQKDSTLW